VRVQIAMVKESGRYCA